MRPYVAIDPGEHFALAMITAKSRVVTTTDRLEAFSYLEKIDKYSIIGIEDVHGVFGAGIKSTFTFGKSVGFWEGVLAYLGLAFVRISIPKWQAWAMRKPDRPSIKGLASKNIRKLKKLHKDSIKMESFRAATVAFPDIRLPSHDVADAVNMARYLRFLNEGNNEKENESESEEGSI